MDWAALDLLSPELADSEMVGFVLDGFALAGSEGVDFDSLDSVRAISGKDCLDDSLPILALQDFQKANSMDQKDSVDYY